MPYWIKGILLAVLPTSIVFISGINLNNDPDPMSDFIFWHILLPTSIFLLASSPFVGFLYSKDINKKFIKYLFSIHLIVSIFISLLISFSIHTADYQNLIGIKNFSFIEIIFDAIGIFVLSSPLSILSILIRFFIIHSRGKNRLHA